MVYIYWYILIYIKGAYVNPTDSEKVLAAEHLWSQTEMLLQGIYANGKAWPIKADKSYNVSKSCKIT